MKKTFDALKRALPHIQDLHPYVPGVQPQDEGWVKLNTNENPYPPSHSVGQAIAAELDNLHKYPEPKSNQLRMAIGQHFGITEQNVIIGNGSDNILDLITRCFVSDPGAAHTVPSYSLYPVLAGMSGQALADVNFDRDMKLDINALSATKAKVVFLTNPNAPTGVAFTLLEIESALRAIDGLLVVDEAYVDFGAQSAVGLLNKYENLVIVRTFSKSYSLAGMRVGFALAAAPIISLLDRIRDAYNLDRLAQAAALAALRDVDYFEVQRQKVINTRELVRAKLGEFNWFTYPSSSNFLFTEPKNADGMAGQEVAKDLFKYLLDNKVLVRMFSSNPLTCSFVRVSIGTDKEMKLFLTVVESWLKHA
ncbi:MAG: histidinol-phosphate transaminase [Verrucomicrobiota bacterium]|nr:histidinol-phosphate transaminase [Verrucomicrobiota bacterium]